MRYLGAVVLAVCVVGAWPASSPADEVAIDQVPPPVRATIEREVGNGRLKEIERETRNGRTVYEVEFERDGDDREIKVAEDGTVVERDD
jgi:hypothetical protein